MMTTELNSCVVWGKFESRWISERLGMGDVSGVRKATGIVNSPQNSHVRKLKERLEKFHKFTD